MAVVHTQTWDSGTTWGPNWSVSGYGSAGVSSGYGTLSSGAATSEGTRVTLSGISALTNTDVTATVQNRTGAGSSTPVARNAVVGVNTDGQPYNSTTVTHYAANGYHLVLVWSGASVTSGSVSIIKTTGGSSNALIGTQLTNQTLRPDTNYKVRIQRTGSTVRAKVWLTDQAEPEAWGISGTDASPITSGKPMVAARQGLVYFDDLAVDDMAALNYNGSATYSGSGALAASGTATSSGALALSGEGALSSTSSAAFTAPIALTGEGALTGTGTGTGAATRSISLAGAGSLSATALTALSGAVSLSGAGTLAAAGAVQENPGYIGTGALTGLGVLSVDSLLALSGEAAFSASGVLTGRGINKNLDAYSFAVDGPRFSVTTTLDKGVRE